MKPYPSITATGVLWTAALVLGALAGCRDSGNERNANAGTGLAGTVAAAGTSGAPNAGTGGFSAGSAAGTSSIGGTSAGSSAMRSGGTGGGAGTSPNAGAEAGAGGTGGVGGAAGVGMLTGGQGGSGGMGPMSGAGGIDDTGGTSAMVDAGGSPTPAPTPSDGCDLAAGRPAGGVVTVAQRHYFAFPESYDGTQPFPVVIGFHGCGDVNRGMSKDDTEWMRLTNGSAFEDDYVRVVPLSTDSGGCWSYGTDIPKVLEMYDDLVANYCVDTSRVFATGHSSGAQFIVQILLTSHVSDAQHLGFKAVAPVAASDYGPMTGPIPAMYIQGMMDMERGNGDGHETVERFRAANGCGDTSMPYSQVAGCQSGATTVNPGCVAYDGCQATTVWCSHNDPQYNGTMHGVPCFGVTAMYDFFESSP